MDVEIQVITTILLRISQNPKFKGRVLHPVLRLSNLYRWAGTIYEFALDSINKKIHLGEQYRYLALYRDQEKLKGLELGLVKGQGAAFNYLKNWVVEASDGSGNFVLSKDAPEDVSILFKGYYFPLMFTSKMDMAEIARQKAFLDLLEMSWFCHTPIDKMPCGTCNPCKVTIVGGMHHRVGQFGLARYEAMKSEQNLGSIIPGTSKVSGVADQDQPA